jgi:hypothetical protein
MKTGTKNTYIYIYHAPCLLDKQQENKSKQVSGQLELKEKENKNSLSPLPLFLCFGKSRMGIVF